MSVRAVDVAAGVALGFVATGCALVVAYVAARPTLPAAIERATVRQVLRYRLDVDRSNPLAGVVADALGGDQLARMIGRVVRDLAEEKLP